MMKQRWGLDRNVLRPTPGDPWGVEQYHWKTGAEENQQLCEMQICLGQIRFQVNKQEIKQQAKHYE